MQAVGRLGSYISQGVYTVSGPFHPFGGAVDIVVVEQQDGSFKSSPWYVRFGKFQGVLKAREKVVNICVNGVEADFQMYLDHKGEAFFLREIDTDVDAESILMCPSSSGDDDADDHSLNSKNNNFDGDKIVGSTSSKRSRILGLVFGRRSLKGEVEDAVGKRVDSFERAEIAANLLELKWSTNISGKQSQTIRSASSGGVDDMIMYDDGLLHQGESKDEACFDVAQDGESDLNRKEVVHGSAPSDDLQVACVELEARLEKQLNVSEENIEESSKVGMDMDSSSEQVHELLYLADGESGEVHVHDEVLHRATILLSEGTENEEVTKNADLGMSITEVSEFHSQAQQTDCSDSDVGMYNDMDVEHLTTSLKPQNGNSGLGHCSSDKVESNCVTKLTSYRSKDDQALDEKENDFFSSLSSPLNCLDGYSPRKESRRLPSVSLEEENFLFSDLDESGINDQFEGSSSPEHVDKEGHISYLNGNEKLRITSGPIAIPRNEDAGEEAGQHTGSLPNISKSLGRQNVCYPLSQSLDSTFLGMDDLKCPESDEDKENQLSHEDPGAKDYHNSEKHKSTAPKLPPGDPSTHNPSSGGNWRIWPFSSRRSGSRKAMLPPPSDAKNTAFDNSSENTLDTDVNKNQLKPNLVKKVRVTTPTSEQVASLNLKEGSNSVTFTFSTAVLGKQQVDARIYLWKWNTRIVVSDVDGTITKSDVLGQFMPLVGIDWSQTGVAHLFSAIKENGYQLLFLSARSISQAYLTRQFLLNLKQDGKILPDGPVVISPDGLFPSLYREVIRRVPHEFKIACLEGIRELFPSDCNPFYAGFGNRDTDEISYLRVGIPKGKIFIINPRGEVVVNRRVDTKSYTSLHALVHGMFPPMNSSEQEDFNSWNFWKLPPPSIDI